MGYSVNVREKLLHTECKNRCCAKAELMGMKIADPLVLSSDNADIKSRILYLGKKADDSEFCLENAKECCLKAFLKGVFEIKGTLSNPDSKRPYVEIYFSDENEAETYKLILNGFSIRAGVSKRRDKFVVYIKNSEGISEFLLLIYASGEALKFIVAKTEREVQNNTNRIMNFDLANIERLRVKYQHEVEAIEKLNSVGIIEKMPEGHRKIAEARLKNHMATYEELGKIIVPNCSKSTISVKMNDIVKEFEKL